MIVIGNVTQLYANLRDHRQYVTSHFHLWMLWHFVSLTLFMHALGKQISSEINDNETLPKTLSNVTTVCPLSCTCTMQTSFYLGEELRTVNCSSLGLSSVPKPLLPEIQSLILSNNSISDLHEQLTSFDHLLELDISRNQINHLGRGYIFFNLSHVRVLNLSGNKFRTLFAGVFRGLKRLEVLIIKDGHLKYVDEHAFDGLENLTELSMENNQLSSVYLELFQSILNLSVLNVGGNGIYHLSGGMFASLSSLRKLDLSHNRIVTINDNAFVGLEILEELHLQGNHLKHVPSVALQSLKRVNYINMGNNFFPQLTTGDFVHTPAQRIDIRRCPKLTLIDRGSFWDLPNIREVHLDNNPHLKYIDPQSFLGVPTLREITLHNASLMSFPSEIINNIDTVQPSVVTHDHEHQRIVRVTLEGNPFLCDCNIHEFFQCLTKPAEDFNINNNTSYSAILQIIDGNKLECHSPASVSGITIKDLPINAIPNECEPKMVNLLPPNVTIHKKIGDRHQFQCRALGIPLPRIYWILPNGELVNETSNAIHLQLKSPGSLRMFHLKPKDSGTYKCVAENKYGNLTFAALLMVDTIDLQLFPVSVSSTFITLVWNGTARNSFPEYQIVYRMEMDEPMATSLHKTNSSIGLSPNKKHDTLMVTVKHFLRSYTINNLKPDHRYRFCIGIPDSDDPTMTFVQLSCTSVRTHSHSYMLPSVAGHVSSLAVALTLSVTVVMLFVICFSVLAARKYNKKHYYETPQKTLVDNMTIPMENITICSPLINAE